MSTATDLIADSIEHDHIAHAPATLDLAATLRDLCSDSSEQADVLEFWGVDDEGQDWRVHLDGSVDAEAEAIIRDLARQDASGCTGGRKDDTGATLDAWAKAAGDAGDRLVVLAIDALARTRAVEIYDEVNPLA